MMRLQESSTNDLAAMIEKLPDLVNGDAALVRRGRTLTVDVLIEIGAAPYYLSIAAGRMPSGCVVDGTSLMSVVKDGKSPARGIA